MLFTVVNRFVLGTSSLIFNSLNSYTERMLLHKFITLPAWSCLSAACFFNCFVKLYKVCIVVLMNFGMSLVFNISWSRNHLRVFVLSDLLSMRMDCGFLPSQHYLTNCLCFVVSKVGFPHEVFLISFWVGVFTELV